MMNRIVGRVRSPVRRRGAERYLLLTLLSFGASVASTRLFLEITGYPQLGSGELHIAHVLWGGLVLFAAALLPLIFANRWAYTLAAVMAGMGVGLFIDEVGKFITQTNDYFHPAAAPIVYALFLLTVFVYLQVRRPKRQDARSELYRAVDLLAEVLDRDLEPSERLALNYRLRAISQRPDAPELARLAKALLAFLESDELVVAPETDSFWERTAAVLRKWRDRYMSQERMRFFLIAGFILLWGVSFFDFLSLLLGASNPVALERLIGDIVALGRVASASGIFWFAGMVALEGFVGLLYFLAAVLLFFRREVGGVAVGFIACVLSLTAVNLLVFYFEQFSTIFWALVQFLLLIATISYRQRFLTEVVSLGAEIVERIDRMDPVEG
jgi:hypothetical protein